MTPILVLSNQESTFTDIKNALNNYIVVHYADSTEQFSDILIDSIIKIVIIDAAFLKVEHQEKIIEVLSFFPELTLIAAVESGETESLVTLFKSFNIYRYLQKPFAADQVSNCINAAIRKQSKNGTDTISLEINDEPLKRNNRKNNKRNNYIFSIAILIVISFSLLLFSNIDDENAPVTDETLPKSNNGPILLGIENGQVKLSGKINIIPVITKKDTKPSLIKESPPEQKQDSATSNKTIALNNVENENEHSTQWEKSGKLISLINNRMDAGNIIYPEDDSVKFYLNKLKLEKVDKNITSALEDKFVSELLKKTSIAIKYNKLDQANIYIKEARTFNIQEKSTSRLEKKLRSSIKQVEDIKLKQLQQARIKQLQKLASNAIENNSLLSPENSSAKYYLQLAIEIEPKNIKTKSQIEALVKLSIIEIETDITENTLASANSKIKKIKELGVNLEDIASLETKLDIAINNR